MPHLYFISDTPTQHLSPAEASSFTLRLSYPVRAIESADYGKTVAELGMLPSAQIVVTAAATPSRPGGMAQAAGASLPDGQCGALISICSQAALDGASGRTSSSQRSSAHASRQLLPHQGDSHATTDVLI